MIRTVSVRGSLKRIRKIGLFKLQVSDSVITENHISSQMYSKDALVALVIPEDFTRIILKKAEDIAARSLKDPDSVNEKSSTSAGTTRFTENVL